VTGIVLAAVAGGAVVAMILVRSPVKHTNVSGGTASASSPSQPPQQHTATQPPTGPPPTSQAPSTGPAAEQAAARGLSQLLTRSTSDRSAIMTAYSDVSACGSGLARDAQTFQQAATSRESLLSQLGTLPDRSALPPQLLQALSGAWQSSIQADQDYAGWAQDERAHGCTANDTSDSHYQAAAAPNTRATADKRAFVSLWNPIATKYGLPIYQQDQL